MGSLSIWHWLIVLLLIGAAPLIGIAVIGWQRKFQIKHLQSGLIKNGFVGWSWTYQLFGWFVPIFRGEIGIGLLHLVLSVCTFGIFQTVMAFLYNRQYTSRMLLQGWELADTEEANNYAKLRLKIAR